MGCCTSIEKDHIRVYVGRRAIDIGIVPNKTTVGEVKALLSGEYIKRPLKTGDGLELDDATCVESGHSYYI